MTGNNINGSNYLIKIEDLFFSGKDDNSCLELFVEYILKINKNNICLENIISSNKKDTINLKNSNLTRQLLYTRLAFILGSLVLRIKESNTKTKDLLKKLINHKSIISAIFDASIFNNSDYFINLLIRRLSNKIDSRNQSISNLDIHKVSVLYSLSSEVEISHVANLFGNNKSEFIMLGFALLSEIFVGSENANKNKDWLLINLSKDIDKVTKLTDIGDDVRCLCSTYMYCSYSENKARHNIKESIHELFRRTNIGGNLQEISKNLSSSSFLRNDNTRKKNILIIHEQLRSNHSMYRCYYRLLTYLKKNNMLTGVCFSSSHIDEKAKKLFHQHKVININNFNQTINNLSELIKKEKFDIVYYPSIGMSFYTILTSSFRLAKIQICSHGHPAPSLSKTIDRVIDYEGVDKSELDPYCKYSFLSRTHPQTLNRPDILPLEKWNIFNKRFKKKNERVTIGITAMPFKLTSPFLGILKILSEKYKHKIEFIIFEAYGSNIINDQITQTLQKIIRSPFVTISKQPFGNYLKLLSKCTIFISPYPFGGHSGFLDCIRMGLIGPCLIKNTFPQNIERHYYKMIGFESLISNSKYKYIEIMSDLIEYANGDSDNSLFIPKNLISPKEATMIITKESEQYNKEIANAFELNSTNI